MEPISLMPKSKAVSLRVMEEETVTKESLVTAIQKLYENRQTYIDAMKQAEIGNGVERVMELIQRF